jgi:hypothetical protein
VLDLENPEDGSRFREGYIPCFTFLKWMQTDGLAGTKKFVRQF